MEGVFKQGEVISILALSQDFGISRTPITIACQQLEYEGFLDIAHKQGVIVRPISISEKQRCSGRSWRHRICKVRRELRSIDSGR